LNQPLGRVAREERDLRTPIVAMRPESDQPLRQLGHD
jgi:hypothetical protein